MKSLNQKHILLVRSGYPAKEFVLKKLKSLGYYVVILDSEKSCPEAYVDEWIVADLTNYTECLTKIHDYLAIPGNFLDGAFTFWEEAILLTAKITETFGWAGNSFESVAKIKNKFTFREVCSEHGLPSPRHHTLKNKVDILDIPSKLEFPLVIKPMYGACSAFVIRVDTMEELEKGYDAIQHYITSFWLAPEWENVEIFAEEYIDGTEVDIDMLLQDGEVKFWSISDNFQTHEPYFIETGQAIPSRLPQPKQDALVKMATKVLSELGIKNGVIHFEAKSSSSGPVPIEINLRMGGDEVYSFVKHAWNVDLIENAAKIAVGETLKIRKPSQPLIHLEGKYFLPIKEGLVRKIDIDQKIHTDFHLFELRLTKNVGDKIVLPPQDFDYMGWITATGKDARQATSNLERLFAEVRFTITPYEKLDLQTHI